MPVFVGFSTPAPVRHDSPHTEQETISSAMPMAWSAARHDVAVVGRCMYLHVCILQYESTPERSGGRKRRQAGDRAT